jgi:hypothetical protein
MAWLRAALAPLWMVVLAIPFPLRVGVVAAGVALAGWWSMPWLLDKAVRVAAGTVAALLALAALPECLLVGARRHNGRPPPLWTRHADDMALAAYLMVQSWRARISARLRRPRRPLDLRWLLLLGLIPIACWYARPVLAGTPAGQRINQALVSWQAFEGWMRGNG